MFRTREPKPLVTLFKSFVLPHLEYCCVLTSPYKATDIAAIESVQRTFTAKIKGLQDLSYWERLHNLKLYSLERRRERYIIIYTWKILEELVPNFSSPESKIISYQTTRHGRKCHIPSVTQIKSIRALRENFLSVRGPRLFNCLPKSIRNISGQSLTIFKKHLDKFLVSVPDEPGVTGYCKFRAADSNSLTDQVRYS